MKVFKILHTNNRFYLVKGDGKLDEKGRSEKWWRLKVDVDGIDLRYYKKNISVWIEMNDKIRVQRG
jgi:hypothetical protein